MGALAMISEGIIIALIGLLGGLLSPVLPGLANSRHRMGSIVAGVVIGLLLGVIIVAIYRGDSLHPSVTPTAMPNPAETAAPQPETINPTIGPACIVTIRGNLPIMQEPDVFSQQLITVPFGDYPSLDYQKVKEPPSNFLQGWFKIKVEGRTGWV